MNYGKRRGEAVRRRVHWAREDIGWTMEMEAEEVRSSRPQDVPGG